MILKLILDDSLDFPERDFRVHIINFNYKQALS